MGISSCTTSGSSIWIGSNFASSSIGWCSSDMASSEGTSPSSSYSNLTSIELSWISSPSSLSGSVPSVTSKSSSISYLSDLEETSSASRASSSSLSGDDFYIISPLESSSSSLLEFKAGFIVFMRISSSSELLDALPTSFLVNSFSSSSSPEEEDYYAAYFCFFSLFDCSTLDPRITWGGAVKNKSLSWATSHPKISDTVNGYLQHDSLYHPLSFTYLWPLSCVASPGGIFVMKSSIWLIFSWLKLQKSNGYFQEQTTLSTYYLIIFWLPHLHSVMISESDKTVSKVTSSPLCSICYSRVSLPADPPPPPIFMLSQNWPKKLHLLLRRGGLLHTL